MNSLFRFTAIYRQLQLSIAIGSYLALRKCFASLEKKASTAIYSSLQTLVNTRRQRANFEFLNNQFGQKTQNRIVALPRAIFYLVVQSIGNRTRSPFLVILDAFTFLRLGYE